MNRNIYLFTCHKISRRLLKNFNKIQDAINPEDSALIFFHQKNAVIPDIVRSYPYTTFSYDDISRLGYPMFKERLTPGSTHFPLVHFYCNNPEHEYYWFIEYDVCYNGKWEEFFNYWNGCDADFLTSHIREQSAEPDWFWWGLEHPSEEIPIENRLRSFNAIYRLSNKAIAFLHQKHHECWRGHYEELLPTLLYYNGLSIRDFGGSGPFVYPRDKNRFYIDAQDDREGLLRKGTMRWRPSFIRPGWKKNKLYHPVKGSAILDFLF